MQTILYWCFDLLTTGSEAVSIITTPFIGVGDYTYSMLTLLTFGGILAYLVVAIVKWAIS